MVIRKIERDGLETEREERLISHLNYMIDTLNTYFAEPKQTVTELSFNADLTEVWETGFYHGMHVEGQDDGFPNGVHEYALLVAASQNGVTQVLFSNKTAKFKVYARFIRNGQMSSWKEL